MSQFNKLSDSQIEALSLLSEECGEVVLAVGKILRHGFDSVSPYDPDGPNNREQLEKELGDVVVAREILLRNAWIEDTDPVHLVKKLRNCQRFLHQQSNLQAAEEFERDLRSVVEPDDSGVHFTGHGMVDPDFPRREPLPDGLLSPTQTQLHNLEREMLILRELAWALCDALPTQAVHLHTYCAKQPLLALREQLEKGRIQGHEPHCSVLHTLEETGVCDCAAKHHLKD